MKLDPTVMRTMPAQDFRVLEAVEKGMNDHALVPLKLVSSLANLRHGGAHKIVSSLLRDKLLSHDTKRQTHVDGYRLTNAGYDILALHALKQRGVVAALGPKIGTGKESDVYLAVAPHTGHQLVLKFHRLGRTSFRNVRQKRDYSTRNNKQNQAHSWLFLSRLSAIKEFAFMTALHDVQYPTPTPLGHSRHVVAMSLVRGIPLYQIYPSQLSVEQAQSIYEQALTLTSRLASHGLVHCDLNEFNLLVDLSGIQSRVATSTDQDKDQDPYVRHSGQSVAGEKSLGALSQPSFWKEQQQMQQRLVLGTAAVQEEGEGMEETVPPLTPAAVLSNGQPQPVVTLIDFPQMVSIRHINAQELYQRDLDCLRRFFERKLQCRIGDVTIDASWESVVDAGVPEEKDNGVATKLDAQVRASGYYSTQANRDLELYYIESGPTRIASAIVEGEEEGEDEDEDEDDSNDENESDGQDDSSARSATDPAATPATPLEQSSAPDGSASDDDDDSLSESNDGAVVEEDLSSVIDNDIHRMRLEARAKTVVHRQIEAQKRKSRKQGAFRKPNSNKSFVKGKRIHADAY